MGCLSWPFCRSASAQDSQLWKLYYDSTQLFWAKDWGKTVGLLERAERSAISDLGIYHKNYLTILNDLGTAYWKARNYTKAEKTLARSLELKAEVYPFNDKEVILSISNLAGFTRSRVIGINQNRFTTGSFPPILRISRPIFMSVQHKPSFRCTTSISRRTRRTYCCGGLSNGTLFR